MFIVIAGGGRLGYYLLKELLHKGEEVILVELDHKRSAHIIEELGNLVVTGDACDPVVLEKAGIQRAEMIIANTGDDENNLVICQIARKKFRVPSAIARVNNPKNEEIFRKLGIAATVSSIQAILSKIEQRVAHKGVMISLAKEGDIEIVETRLTSESPAVDQKIEKLKLPKKCMIGAVIRGGEILSPQPDLELKENDLVITFTRENDFKKLRDVMMGQDIVFHAP
ncbi:MAG: TrkA family potassium uptake protein [Candidatus Eremiobacteraeota bacterium]|nr:TrkA family potassium uptake protein [Candidatus Eremiobacteraeota bacterium]